MCINYVIVTYKKQIMSNFFTKFLKLYELEKTLNKPNQTIYMILIL